MNKERILQLADAIENEEVKFKNKKVKFALDEWFGPEGEQSIVINENYCDSVACIAGSACILFDENFEKCVSNFSTFDGFLYSYCFLEKAAELLDITTIKAHLLFEPHIYFNNFDKVSASQAAKVLRNFAETGRIEWSLVYDYENEWLIDEL